MTENIDYVLVKKATSIGTEGLTTINKGMFIGTKEYLFYVPYKLEEHTSRKITTFSYSIDGEGLIQFICEKLSSKNLRVKEFEDYMKSDFKQMIPETLILNLKLDIEQLKITTSWLGSGIYYNTTIRKNGWKPFVQKLGVNKKTIKLFYQNNIKLIN